MSSEAVLLKKLQDAELAARCADQAAQSATEAKERADKQKAEALALREETEREMKALQRRTGGDIVNTPWPNPGADGGVIQGPTVAILDVGTGERHGSPTEREAAGSVHTPVYHVTLAGLARLPAFCHATLSGGQVHMSGILGTRPGALELTPGGIGSQTSQALANIEAILAASGSSVQHLVKLQVFVCDNSRERFEAMNEAYLKFFQERELPVCARLFVGCASLALGADVQVDGCAVAPLPSAASQSSSMYTGPTGY